MSERAILPVCNMHMETETVVCVGGVDGGCRWRV